jgi:hypothetical protein
VSSPARLPLTGMPVASTGERSALLAAWATACARGAVTVSDAVAAVTGHDEPHVVDAGDVPSLESGDGLAGVLSDLRRRRAGLRLVLPIPGDPRGLPGPGAFTDAALETGEAVRLQGTDPAGYGLVPLVTRQGSDMDGYAVLVVWRAFAAEPAGPGPIGSRRAAEQDLHEALRDATAALNRLDVGRLGPAAAAQLAELRDPRRHAVRLPRSHPANGRSLWEQAARLALILDIASSDDGAAVDRAAMLERRELLRRLAAAARQAKVAAVNAAWT